MSITVQILIIIASIAAFFGIWKFFEFFNPKEKALDMATVTTISFIIGIVVGMALTLAIFGFKFG